MRGRQVGLSRGAQNALRRARGEAARLGHGYVGSEHLLLGLLREEEDEAAQTLRGCGFTLAGLRQAAARLLGTGERGCAPAQGLTRRARSIVERSAEACRRQGARRIGTRELLDGLLQEGDGAALRLLGEDGEALERLVLRSGERENGAFWERRGGRECETVRESRLLDQYARDLTRLAQYGQLDPVTGRDAELERVIQILCRRTKNNPVLLGEPGVGKTAVAEALAQRLSAGTVPEPLLGRRLLALDLSSTVAGTKYRGEFEERVKRIMKEVQRLGNIILFLDELHTIVGAGSAEGSIDAANILKPALSRGELQVLGATTQEEYRRSIRRDAALERRFQPVTVEPPEPEAAVAILEQLRERYERHHQLRIAQDALEAAVELSVRYLPERFLPDKAVDLMDEAAARARIAAQQPPAALRRLDRRRREALDALEQAIQEQNYEKAALCRDAEQNFARQLAQQREHWHSESVTVHREDVARVVADWTGIPVTAISQAEGERLLGLEALLHQRVVGQHRAVSALARAIRRSRSGLQEEQRPVGSFLFAGPSGVGKTELCRALAEALFGSEEALLRLDMSEFREAQSVSRLIGSPPGYVGYEEGGRLTEAVRRRPYQVVLLDELEKAHPEVLNLLLQVLEDGRLTDAHGARADFRSTVIVMTTNAGADAATRLPPGFASGAQEDRDRALLSALRRQFRPEFLNRIDELLLFQPLSGEEVRQVARLMLERCRKRLERLGVTLRVGDDALSLIARRGTEPGFGVRPMRRFLRTQLEDPAAHLLLSGQLKRGGKLRVEAAADGLRVSAGEGGSAP